jgi:hypothetical protein
VEPLGERRRLAEFADRGSVHAWHRTRTRGRPAGPSIRPPTCGPKNGKDPDGGSGSLNQEKLSGRGTGC